MSFFHKADDDDDEDAGRPKGMVLPKSRPIDDLLARTRASARKKKLKIPKIKTASRSKKNSDSEFSVDTAFASMLEHSRNESGAENVYTAGESEQMILGLALPALSLRYLFQMDVCPLARIIQITGARGSCKSGLLYEMMRWTVCHDGIAALLENEGKDSPDLRASILENNKMWLEHRVMVEECDALEDWQEGLQRYVEYAGKLCDAKKSKKTGKVGKSNWVFPFFFGVDSFMSTNARETASKINNKGSAERGWALEANLIARYSRNLPSWLRGKPILIAGTNHLKEGTDSGGRPQDNVPGGKAIGFYETLEIKMQKIKPIDTVDHGGIRVQLTTAKNSLGQTGRKIQANMMWQYVPDPLTGDPVQVTHWDWYAATIDMLLSLKKFVKVWDAVNEIVDLHEASGRRVWSKALGISSEKPALFTKAGRMIEKRPEMMESLYPILRIKRRTQFRPGEDYKLQIQRAERVSEDTTRYYKIHDLSSMAYIDRELTAGKKKRKVARSHEGGDDE